MADPLNEIRATLTGAANEVSAAGEQFSKGLEAILKQWIEFNRQSCARAMITGISGPEGEKQAQGLENLIRAANNHNHTLKQRPGSEPTQDDTPRLR